MSETPGVFEVADGEFACGVAAVVPVGFDRGQRAVRFPRVVRSLPHSSATSVVRRGVGGRCRLVRPRVGGAGRLLPRLGPGW